MAAGASTPSRPAQVHIRHESPFVSLRHPTKREARPWLEAAQSGVGAREWCGGPGSQPSCCFVTGRAGRGFATFRIPILRKGTRMDGRPRLRGGIFGAVETCKSWGGEEAGAAPYVPPYRLCAT